MAGQLEKFTIFTGPMNSGKTGSLINHLHVAQDALEYRISVFKPATDSRNGDLDKITCRNGGSWCAIPTPKLSDNSSSSLFIIDNIFRNKQMLKPNLVGIDEVQFFDRDIKDVVRYLLSHQIEVAVSGLNRDFRFEPFPAMESLMPLADRVETLTARCTHKNDEYHICGHDATRTQRLIDGKPASYYSPIVIIEGKGKGVEYEARCIDHWSCPDVPQSRLQEYLNRG